MPSKRQVILYILGSIAVLVMFILLAQDEGYQAMMEDVGQDLKERPLPQTPGEFLDTQTPEQARLLVSAALVWVGGVTALIVWQMRKAGYSWGYCLNPLNFSTGYFDTKAWVIFVALAAAALYLFSEAMPLSPIR